MQAVDRALEGSAKKPCRLVDPMFTAAPLAFGWCGRGLRGLPARRREVGQLEKPSPCTWSTAAASTRWIAFRAHRHHRAAGVAEYALGDAARYGAPYPAQAAASQDDQVYLQFPGQVHDLLGHCSHPEVGAGHGPAGNFHSPGELSERLPALFLDLLVEFA